MYKYSKNQNIKLKKENNEYFIDWIHKIWHHHYTLDKLQQCRNDADFTEQELIRYAEYIEEAMRLNIPDIIAHPDVYMLSRKNFGKIEEKVVNMICKSAEKYNVPLEINLNDIFYKIYFENKILNNLPVQKQKEKLANVKYPCKGFWNVVTNYNIKVLYGIDAHYKGQIALWNELLELADEILGEELIDELRFVCN